MILGTYKNNYNRNNNSLIVTKLFDLWLNCMKVMVCLIHRHVTVTTNGLKTIKHVIYVFSMTG